MARIAAIMKDKAIIKFLTPFASFLLLVLTNQDNNKKGYDKNDYSSKHNIHISIYSNENTTIKKKIRSKKIS